MTDSDIPGALFTQAAYLEPLIESGCVSLDSGWNPLREISPLAYAKSHSWGEFVFDFEIAQLHERFGLSYYPKLLWAVPFTPVAGPRLGALGAADLQQACEHYAASSVHVLFPRPDEREALLEQDWIQRQDIRFIWRNRGYADFDEFLAALSSKKRKNLRAERRAVAALGLSLEWRSAGELALELLPRIYDLYAKTYLVRGQSPYLNLHCLKLWVERMPQQMQFALAWQADDLVAMAFFFQDDKHLYGRHWGSAIDGEKLHFELCYYQGIEHCIRSGRDVFDAGVQGSHRLLRGFEPQLSDSMHWFNNARLHTLLKPAFQREIEHIQAVFDDAQARTAYRRSE